jgi:single-strand DNA-binding protein
VHVQDFTFLTTKKESMDNAQSGNRNQPHQDTPTTANKANGPLDDNGPEEEDDLPF